MIYGIPIEIFVGLGAGLVAGGLVFMINPNWHTKKLTASMIGVGVGFLAAAATYFWRNS